MTTLLCLFPKRDANSQFSHRLPLPPCRETFFNNEYNSFMTYLGMAKFMEKDNTGVLENVKVRVR